MLIFEILYKNPAILQPNPLFELEAGEGAQERLGRGVFRSAIQVQFEKSYFVSNTSPGCLDPIQQAATFRKHSERERANHKPSVQP